MAHYVVRARLRPERTEELRQRLQARAFETIRPFGRGLSNSLKQARIDPQTDETVWEVQCFCTPPLAAERPAVLDRYFEDIKTETVAEGEGWRRIETLPALWEPAL